MITHTIAYIFEVYLKWWFYLFIIIMFFKVSYERLYLFDNKSLVLDEDNYNLAKRKLNIGTLIYIFYIFIVIFMDIASLRIHTITTKEVVNYSRNLKIFPIIIYTVYLFGSVNKLSGLRRKKTIFNNLYVKLSLLVISLICIIVYYFDNKSSIINKTVRNEYALENKSWNDYMQIIFYNISFDSYFDTVKNDIDIPWSSTKNEVKQMINATLIEETNNTLTYSYNRDTENPYSENLWFDSITLSYYFNENNRFYKLVTDLDIKDVKFNKYSANYYLKDRDIDQKLENGNFTFVNDKNKYLDEIITNYNKSVDSKTALTTANFDETSLDEYIKNLYEGKAIFYSIEGFPDSNDRYSPYSLVYKDFYVISMIKIKDFNTDQKKLVLERVFYNSISKKR